MLGSVLGAVRGFFSNGAGGAVGNTVANGVSTIALIAAIAPAVLWLIGNKDEVAVAFSFTWGQLSLIGFAMFFVLKIIHYSRPGSPRDRDGF